MYKAHDTSTNTGADTNPYLNEYEKEFTIKQNIKNLTPKIYFDYFSILFNSPYILGIDKLFHSKITVNSIALWNGVGDFNWHWDGPGNDDIYALVYFSTQTSSLSASINMSECIFFNKKLPIPWL
jgi:hypothetical protein